jgi:hypothetical protein
VLAADPQFRRECTNLVANVVATAAGISGMRGGATPDAAAQAAARAWNLAGLAIDAAGFGERLGSMVQVGLGTGAAGEKEAEIGRLMADAISDLIQIGSGAAQHMASPKPTTAPDATGLAKKPADKAPEVVAKKPADKAPEVVAAKSPETVAETPVVAAVKQPVKPAAEEVAPAKVAPAVEEVAPAKVAPVAEDVAAVKPPAAPVQQQQTPAQQQVAPPAQTPAKKPKTKKAKGTPKPKRKGARETPELDREPKKAAPADGSGPVDDVPAPDFRGPGDIDPERPWQPKGKVKYADDLPNRVTPEELAEAAKASEGVHGFDDRSEGAKAETHEDPTFQSGTEKRSGVSRGQFDEAEVSNRLRIETEGRQTKKVAYGLTAEDVQFAEQSKRGFAQDPATPTPQSTDDAYTHSGFERGHLAQREAFFGSAGAERAADQLTNVVPMTEAMNRGTGSGWRAQEMATIEYARKLGRVTVEIDVHYDANPRTLPDGVTPIPKAVTRTIKGPDGQVLESATFLNLP